MYGYYHYDLMSRIHYASLDCPGNFRNYKDKTGQSLILILLVFKKYSTNPGLIVLGFGNPILYQIAIIGNPM